MDVLNINEPMLLENSLEAETLVLGPEAVLTAPEGKLITLTAGGVQQELAPGTFTGGVRLAVTERVPAPIKGMHDRPGEPPVDFRTAISGTADGVDADNSVLSAYVGGSIAGTEITGGSITSHGESFNSMILSGGSYTVRDLHIENTGHSPDDGKGLGASVLVGGDATAVFENVEIRNQGIRNDAIVTGGDAAITVRNSVIDVKGGTPEQIQALNKIRPGKASMTYVSGGWGTTRAVNVQNNSSAVFENCQISSENWGVLSTDGIDTPKEWGPVKTRIYAKDCDVRISGHHGYGSYAIGDCCNIFDHTKMYAPDVALKVANELAGGEFRNGCEITGGRFGVMWQSNQGGRLTVRDSTIRSGRSTFIARSCFPEIYCENAVLQAGNRIILQMFDSDDPGFGKPEVEVDTEVPVKDPDHDVTKPAYHPFSVWGFPQENWCTDLRATFKDMTITGDFYNGITNAAKPKFPGAAPGGAPGGAPAGGPGGPGGAPGGAPAGGPGGAPAGAPAGGPGGAPGGAPAGMPPMAAVKNYPINMVLTLDHVELEGVISASHAQHAVKTISGENRKEIYQVYDTPCPVVNNGVIVTLKNGTVWTVIGKSYMSALHIDETSRIRTPDGCDVRLVVNGETIPCVPGDYTGDILVSAFQVETPAMF